MSSVRAHRWHQDLESIFRGGTLSVLGDSQLLELFLSQRETAGEQAFRMLVDRHGPMVYRVCVQGLGDSHEAQDAFQAVFLVLARRGGTVRNRESLSGWLYGVALRVTARARTRRNRRKRSERPVEGGDEEITGQAVDAATYPIDVEAVHQEIGRLAEKYRTPVVLCYLEGLTHEQAAVRLNWPVGTVRSRLARARGQLRERLIRRGITVPAAIGPLAGWLGLEAAATADAATAVAALFSEIPIDLLATTLRSVGHMVDGKAATVALFSSNAFTLTRGVLNTMAIEKAMSLAWTVLPACVLVITAGLVIGHEPGAQQNPQEATVPGPGTKVDVAPLRRSA